VKKRTKLMAPLYYLRRSQKFRISCQTRSFFRSRRGPFDVLCITPVILYYRHICHIFFLRWLLLLLLNTCRSTSIRRLSIHREVYILKCRYRNRLFRNVFDRAISLGHDCTSCMAICKLAQYL